VATFEPDVVVGATELIVVPMGELVLVGAAELIVVPEEALVDV
jgi:hypothetical protein